VTLKTIACALLAGTMLAAAAARPAAAAPVPKLDHVFLIMMENHGYAEVINNPYEPFADQEAQTANLATNYFAVAHPSLTNYLEVVGGSNFGIQDDNSPDWHNANCMPNIASLIDNNEADPNPICPIAGSGTDAYTPAIDYTNETSGPPGVLNVNGVRYYNPAPTVGETIGDQLVAVGKTWKSYQESLTPGSADGVNTADGIFNNLTVFTAAEQAMGENTGAEVALYAVKHDPFAYFANVQAGTNPANSLANIVAFDGGNGLYADLASGHAPNFSFIVPNQCNDQHGRGNSTVFCNYDPNDNGTQNGLNPALIQQGDIALQKVVTAIKGSPVWTKGNNAIVIIWDESDYSIAPITNQVAAIIDTSYGVHGVQSSRLYTHFNLLHTIEAGLGLPCLNHACDAGAYTMNDLFAK
jgi:hypothetical protein